MLRSRLGWMRKLALTVVLPVAGCGGPVTWTRVTVNRPLDAQDVAFIAPGETKWDDVVKRLGVPNNLVGEPDGVVADYYFYDGKRFDVDFGWPLNFVPPASYAPHSFDLGGSGIGVDTFQVGFDAKGTVRHAGFSHAVRASKFILWPFGSYVP